MKGHTLLVRVLTLFFSFYILVSCSNDEPKPDLNEVKITIKANCNTKIDYSNFKVKITDLRSNSTIEKPLKNGSAIVLLNKDIYTFIIEGKHNNIDYFGKKESHSIKAVETIDIKVLALNDDNQNSSKKGLIFNEVFFNGGTYNGRMQHPDQYLTIFNNSDRDIYADGVVIAQCAHINWGYANFGTVFVDGYLPNNIVVRTMYQIPGNGTDYLIKPGKQIVVAATAIDHGATLPGAANLSGADFEAYDPDITTNDVDDPNIPNLIRHQGLFNFFPKGAMPLFIFYPEEPMSTFMEKNKEEFENDKGETVFLYKVPTNLVLDGIETGIVDDLKTKAFPDKVDKGFIGVTGCHSGLLIKRKSVFKNGREYLIDENNSTTDCVVEKKPTSYPAK